MNLLRQILNSPEFYPVILDSDRRVLQFVRMSRESYRNSVFLDLRTRCLGEDSYDIRVDDLLLAARAVPQADKPVHYILNSAYCCSTLLSRYFEMVPSCFVLKEPRLLAQLAVMPRTQRLRWNALFDLAARLLARTYDANEMVVVKPVDLCTLLGATLLEQNHRATVTFLIPPLRHFLLSILKAGERREWVRTRVQTLIEAGAPRLMPDGVDPDQLSVAEAAACLWQIHHFLGAQLCAGAHRSRVMMLNGDELAESPKTSLSAVFSLCGLPFTEEQLDSIVGDPRMGKYSKDFSRPYDSQSRRLEFAELERCWGAEADSGMEWAERSGHSLPTAPAA